MSSCLPPKKMSMYQEILRETRKGDKEKILMMHREMALYAECHMCGAVFRNVRLLLNHGMLYCKGRAVVAEAEMLSLPGPDPKAQESQTKRVKAGKKAREASSDVESSQTSEGAGTSAPSRRGRQRKRTAAAAETKAKSRSGLVLEKEAEPGSSLDFEAPPIPELISGQHSISGPSGRSRKQEKPLRMNSSLELLTEDANSGQATRELRMLGLAEWNGASGILDGIQKVRTSTRERKAPKWMQVHEEEARGQATSGSRKRSAPKDAENKTMPKETSSKPAKRSRLGNGHPKSSIMVPERPPTVVV